jgi:hypothetical protein
MSVSESNSAVLDAPASVSAPAVSEAAPNSGDKPSGEATPASERNGQAEKTEVPRGMQDPHTRDGVRDEKTGRFVAKTGDEPKAKAAAKPAAPTAPAVDFDAATISRAEAAGLTAYAAKKFGDVAKLNAEIDRREAAARRQQEEAARKPVEQPATKPEAKPNTPAAPKDAAAEEDKLAKLGDLDAAYEDLSPRDKIYREEFMRLREKESKYDSLVEKLDRFEKIHQQDEEARQAEAIRKDASEFDAMVEELGEEFTPIFGKGSYENVPAAYVAERSIPFAITRDLREAFPQLAARPLKDIARTVVSLFYPDEFNQHQQRDSYSRARHAADKRPPASRSTQRDSGEVFTDRARDNPKIQEIGRRAERERLGLE